VIAELRASCTVGFAKLAADAVLLVLADARTTRAVEAALQAVMRDTVVLAPLAALF